jgi:hypothetical protein
VSNVFDGSVDEKADVRDREVGDAADFLVTESVLKLQADDFLLIRGQGGKKLEYLPGAITALGGNSGRRLAAFVRFQFDTIHRRHSAFLSSHIQGPVSANGIEPFGQVPLQPFLRLRAQLHEGVLHHVARAFNIARDLRGVARQWTFELPERCVHPIRFV